MPLSAIFCNAWLKVLIMHWNAPWAGQIWKTVGGRSHYFPKEISPLPPNLMLPPAMQIVLLLEQHLSLGVWIYPGCYTMDRPPDHIFLDQNFYFWIIFHFYFRNYLFPSLFFLQPSLLEISIDSSKLSRFSKNIWATILPQVMPLQPKKGSHIVKTSHKPSCLHIMTFPLKIASQLAVLVRNFYSPLCRLVGMRFHVKAQMNLN